MPRYGVARVVVCFSRTHPERTTEMLKGLAGQVGVSIVPRYYELITSRSHVEDLSGLPMLDIAPASLSPDPGSSSGPSTSWSSSVILLVAAPFFAVVAVTIKATSAGPVFFRQVRTGRNEQPFSMMKFRTMYRDAESRRHELDHLNEVDGPLFKVQNDPRVTRVGRFLRRTSLDEFPQLINVWKGDMSLVGPRPFVVAEAMEIEGWARKRFEARPGHDRTVAGVGAQRALPPRAVPARLPLRGLVVVLVGHADPLADAEPPSSGAAAPPDVRCPAGTGGRGGMRRSVRTNVTGGRSSATTAMHPLARTGCRRELLGHGSGRASVRPRRPRSSASTASAMSRGIGLVEEHPGGPLHRWCRGTHPTAGRAVGLPNDAASTGVRPKSSYEAAHQSRRGRVQPTEAGVADPPEHGHVGRGGRRDLVGQRPAPDHHQPLVGEEPERRGDGLDVLVGQQPGDAEDEAGLDAGHGLLRARAGRRRRAGGPPRPRSRRDRPPAVGRRWS